MNLRPVRTGVMFALICHVITWLTLGIPTYFGYGDAGFIAATVLLGLHVVLLGVFKRG